LKQTDRWEKGGSVVRRHTTCRKTVKGAMSQVGAWFFGRRQLCNGLANQRKKGKPEPLGDKKRKGSLSVTYTAKKKKKVGVTKREKQKPTIKPEKESVAQQRK